jgi:hypothetical protein
MSRTLIGVCAIAALAIVVGVAGYQMRNVNAQGKGQEKQAVKLGLQADGTFVASDGAVFKSQQACIEAGRRCPVEGWDSIREGEIRAARSGVVTTALAPGSVFVNVYFHVIQQNGTAGVSGIGFVSTQQINAQMNVLNNAYAGLGPDGAGADTPFRFQLVDIDYVVNSSWFNAAPGTTAEAQMKSTLRRGTCRDMNIYTNNAAGFLGYATFPSDCAANQDNDGVVLLYDSLPGGEAVPYNLGDTAVHEAGHWLGLFHTFQGGCSGNGDFVSDTPAERSPAYGCPSGRDSCRNSSGGDPITNFMDYSDDFCMFRFSSGQSARMDDMWVFRQGR